MSQPNIILIICDQMRGDAMGADGNPQIYTPNLDYLASQGGRFNHAYSAVPSCLPARACLWTGQSQWHTGVLGMGRGQGPIPHDFPNTLAGTLTHAGYRTHLIGKGHFSPQRTPMGFESLELDESGRMPTSDFRRWFADNAPSGVSPDDHGVDWNSWHARPWHTEERLHPTYWTMSRSLDFLEHYDEQRPFFLNISFARPHSPYDPPQHYFDRYYPGGDLPEPSVGEWAQMHDDPATALNPNAWRGRMTPDQIRRARAGYYGSISFIDTQIGRLMCWMRRHPQIYKNTWFLFTADHGDMQGDHNLWRKTYAYEGSTRIPFLLVPPAAAEKPKRGIVDEVVELRDVMPTLLEAAGVPLPDTMDGQSLVPLLEKPDENWRPYIHGEHCTCYSEEQEMQYVTDGKRKFVWLPKIGVEQFFNLETDPGECTDLSSDPVSADEVAQWRGYLITELEQRNCGWVKDGKLHCPEEPLVSPYKAVRWSGHA